MKSLEASPNSNTPIYEKWIKTLKDVKFKGVTEKPEQPLTPSQVNRQIKKHQAKIIDLFINNRTDALERDEPVISGKERKAFIDVIREGQIGDKHWEYVLNRISGPENLKTPEDIYSSISQNKYASQILAYMTATNPKALKKSGAEPISNFFLLYKNPMQFEEDANSYLEKFKNAPKNKAKHYYEGMEYLKKTMFGKKQEYWDAIKAIKSEASNFDDYMNNAIIDGDPFESDGKFYNLSKDFLEIIGLNPNSSIKIDNKIIGLSSAFQVEDHVACLAYVPTGKGVMVRGYYRSESSGAWRYLPDYTRQEGWYGKGFDEESLTLPFEMQKKLAEISKKPLVDITEANAAFCFFGTAKAIKTQDEYFAKKNQDALQGDHYKESSHNPLFNFGKTKRTKEPPEKVGAELVNNPLGPDFSRKIDSYTMHTKLYGEVTANLYLSKNGLLRYAVCETNHNGKHEAWINSITIEKNGITSAGTAKNWVSAGDIITPLYEYTSMANNYGNPADINSEYTNMWDNYISKTPLIKLYQDYAKTK